MPYTSVGLGAMAAKTLTVTLSVNGILFFCHLATSQDCVDEFTTQPQDVVARAGGMALMECDFTSSRGSSPVQWRRDITVILDTDSPCDCHVTSDGSLLFNNISAADVGEYDCFVFVGFGMLQSCSATLRLATAPEITNKMGPGSVLSTNRELSVHVTGDPLPEVEWFHGDSVLSNSTRISISSHETGNGRIERLTISGIQPEDRGLYTLHATNTGGEVTVEWIVLVVFGNVRITESEDEDEILLTCEGEFYSVGTVQLLWIRGEENVAVTGQETQTTTNNYDTSFETSLHVPLSSCRGTSEVVKCQLNHDSVEGLPQKTSANVTICDDVEVIFSSEDVTVTDDVGSVDVCVEVSNEQVDEGVQLHIPIAVKTVAGSAEPNMDFAPFNNMTVGEASRAVLTHISPSHCFSITILARPDVGLDNRSFFLNIRVQVLADTIEPNIERIRVPNSDFEITVKPSGQIEVGDIRDSVLSNPVFSVAVDMKGEEEDSNLCYEVSGESGVYLNLVSDVCFSINARYEAIEEVSGYNKIEEVAITTSDTANGCSHILITAKDNCISASVYHSTQSLVVNTRYRRNDVQIDFGDSVVAVLLPCRRYPGEEG